MKSWAALPVPASGTDAALQPRAVKWALWATLAWAGFTMLSALALFAERPFLRQALVDANAKAKAPIADYTGAKVTHDVSRVLTGGTLQSVLVIVILVMLGLFMYRGRGWARWALLGFATVLPIIVPVGLGVIIQLLGGINLDAPWRYKAPLIAAGSSALVVAILLVLPETTRWFASLRAPGRRGLFARAAQLPSAGPRPGDAPAGRLGREDIPAVRAVRGGPSGRFAGRAAGRGPSGDTQSGRPAGSAFSALFGPRRRSAASSSPDGSVAVGSASDSSTAVDSASIAVDGGSTAAQGRSSAKRLVATRPGTVKPKGVGGHSGRSKSREQ